MRNDVGLYALFGDNIKSKKVFYEWCKNNDELCEYDIEHIENDLFIPCIDNTNRYFHFSNGNILDFLEEHGYYIGLPIRGAYKFVTCVYKKTSTRVGYPIYNNSGVNTRQRALELGVINAIKDLEINIK